MGRPLPLARVRVIENDVGMIREVAVLVDGEAVAQLPVHGITRRQSAKGLAEASFDLHVDYVDHRVVAD